MAASCSSVTVASLQNSPSYSTKERSHQIRTRRWEANFIAAEGEKKTNNNLKKKRENKQMREEERRYFVWSVVLSHFTRKLRNTERGDEEFTNRSL